MKNVKLVNKLVGDNYPCYYVAEIGGSFQNFKESKRLIDSAIDIGIDAVKFQTLEAETITTKNNFFDMIYIDGNHLYNFVLSDLLNSLDKRKSDGLIICDDYKNDCG